MKKYKIQNQYSIHLFVQLFILIVFCVLDYYFGERIPVNGGFGFESFGIFKPIIINFNQFFFGHKIDSYAIQRILPFALVHLFMKGFRLTFTDGNILKVFTLYQLLIQLTGVIIWSKISKHLKISTKGYWLGFIALFISFHSIKADFYHPISYDRTALVLSLASCYFYLTNKVFSLFVVSVLGLAVWPTNIVVSLILLLFPVWFKWIPNKIKQNHFWFRDVTTLLIFLTSTAFFSYVYFNHPSIPAGISPPVRLLLPFSIIFTGLYLSIANRILITNVTQSFSTHLSSVNRKWLFRLFPACCLLFAFLFLVKFLPDTSQPPHLSFSQFLINHTLCATSRPFQFFIAHSLYFGPLFGLIWPKFNKFCARFTEFGLGFTLVIALGIGLLSNSESRTAINILPFFIVPLILTLEDLNPSWNKVVTIGILSIVFSRFWLPLNFPVSKLEPSIQGFYPMVGDFQRFPAQLFFMNFTPWTANNVLLAQTILVLFVSIYLFNLFSKNSQYKKDKPF